MTHDTSRGWEPDPQKTGNWRAALMQDRGAPIGSPSPAAQGEAPQAQAPHADVSAPDPGQYKPWIMQRARTAPALMLEFRRYEPRSGLWTGWAIAYPHLVALEYTGDKLLSLDFGARQIVVEGRGLDELARHIQQGTVLAIQEYALAIWPSAHDGPSVSAIRNVKTAPPKGA